MRVVQRPAGDDPRVVAEDASVAWTRLQRARGVMFRRSVPKGAMVFPFDGAGRRGIHTLFVPMPLDVVWVVDGRVTAVRRLRAWFDAAWATADTVVEFPAGGADGIERGDEVYLEGAGTPEGGRTSVR